MTIATSQLEAPALTTAAFATEFDHAQPLVVPGRLQRAAAVVGDLLGAGAALLFVPILILVIGIPIALLVRLLLWMGGLL